jgi:hypothetical protein
MSTPCTVIIGATELLETLRECAAENTEVLEFGDHEPLKALEAITARRPKVIAVERLFAATSRGAALINRVKADPDLTDAEIRVVSVDGTYRVSPRRKAARPASKSRAPEPTPVAAIEVSAEPDQADEDVTAPESSEAAQNLDYRGTRRAPRFRMVEGTEVQVDGALAKIVDLSTHGAQILCTMPLKPQQKVRMVLADDLGNVKLSATVAWASFEIPKGVSRYRAGVEFSDAEPKAVAAFCKRHKS